MAIYLLAFFYFGFLSWCFHQAWYNNTAFIAQIDKMDSYFYKPNILSVSVISWLFISSIGGMVWSWYQV